ncbi:MAG TPA: nodulation protein NfeD [Ardenticatenaceae bacterium]|nr:nodulation protein NfeD [Ardenticatenaceae bacterium]
MTRRLRLLVWSLVLLAGTLGMVAPLAAQGADGPVILLTAEGAVSPAMEVYLRRGIDLARREGAALLVIQLNTPGGEVGVTNQIVSLLSDAPVPTVVYVAPAGAHAASAGTLVTLAADLAAMAPRTRIGAASPVAGGGQELDPTLAAKAQNDLAALARSLASTRGDEAIRWAEEAVRDAVSATEAEALELGVVDAVAADVPDLLRQLDGRTVTVGTAEVTLRVAEATIREVPMNPLEEFLQIITNPNIALLLLSFGSAAILIELYSPGGYVAGIAGIIALVLGFYALGQLNANWAGLALMGLAIVLFVIDVKAPSHGVLTIGGVVAFILGAVILFNTSFAPASLALIAGLGLGMGAFFAFAVTAAMRARRAQPLTGKAGMVGMIGEVRSALDPQGFVLVHGERWRAISPLAPVAEGGRVRVLGVEGMRLIVEPVPNGAAAEIEAGGAELRELRGTEGTSPWARDD